MADEILFTGAREINSPSFLRPRYLPRGFRAFLPKRRCNSLPILVSAFLTSSFVISGVLGIRVVYSFSAFIFQNLWGVGGNLWGILTAGVIVQLIFAPRPSLAVAHRRNRQTGNAASKLGGVFAFHAKAMSPKHVIPISYILFLVFRTCQLSITSKLGYSARNNFLVIIHSRNRRPLESSIFQHIERRS